MPGRRAAGRRAAERASGRAAAPVAPDPGLSDRAARLELRNPKRGVGIGGVPAFRSVLKVARTAIFAAAHAFPVLSETSLNTANTAARIPKPSSDAPADALELHFRKMAEYPLLTHEGEVALARRLERADLGLARALLESVDGRAALRDVAQALRDREVKMEDVERNPTCETSDELASRLDRITSAASRGPRPRTFGLRLHPRTVRRIEDELAARAVAEPRNTKLRSTVDELARLRREADEATAEFVRANLRIVVTFARRYRGMPLVDLIQEGNIGLLRAVDKFDHRRGLRFSTYAAWWIRHALTRALADQSKMIRLPVHLTGAVQRVRRAQDRLQRESGIAPTPEELSARTGLPLTQVRRALDVVAQPVSLDVPVSGEREAADLGEFVQDLTAKAADETLAAKQLEADAHELLATLPAREAEVLRLRYGVGGGTQRTLEEVGARLSLSRERARQLERDALKKLRAASEKRRLRVHLEG